MKIRSLLCLLLILTGCMQIQPRDAQIDRASDGAVMVQILVNSPNVSFFFKNWQTITLERVSSPTGEHGDKFSLRKNEEATSRSAIYAGSLPPGTYRLGQFNAGQCGAMCVSNEVDISSDFSRFAVQSGQLTDLGVIIQTPVKDRLVFVHSQAPANESTRERVQALFPGLSPLLAKPTLSWDGQTVKADMTSAFELSKALSFGVMSLQQTTENTFIYASANGVIYEWTPGQPAVAHDVGVRNAIESALVTGAGTWLAGGELGTLRQSDDQGRHWRSIRGNLPFGVVTNLHQWKDQVIATTLRGNSIYIHSAPLGSDHWTQLARYEKELSLRALSELFPTRSYLLGNELVSSVPGDRVGVLNLENRQSALYPLPGGISLFWASNDGVLHCSCAASMIFNPYESHDHGKTWQDSTHTRYMFGSNFRDKNNGVALHYVLYSDMRMAYTQNGGTTWTETTALSPTLINEFFYSRDGKSVFASMVNGNLLQSKDDGRSWTAAIR